MTEEELKEYTKNHCVSRIINDLKKNNSELSNIVLKNEEYIGLWDISLNKPFLIQRAKIKKTCVNVNCCKEFISPYLVWIKKSEENKLLCPSCGRSKTLSNLNKGIIKEKVTEYWKSSRSDDFRKELSEKFVIKNKTTLREHNLNLSTERKEEIKNKKIITWFSRSEEERAEINKTRNIYLNWDEERREEQVQKLKHWAIENKELLSYRAEERWKNYSKEKRDEILRTIFISSHNKKKHNDYDLFFQGSYEQKFLDECYKAGLFVEKGPYIEYYDSSKNKIRTYMIDFVVNNYLIEIKSKYIWKKHLECNLCKKSAAENYSAEHTYNGYKIFILDQENTSIEEGIKDCVETLKN